MIHFPVPEALTFDDVLLLPARSDVIPETALLSERNRHVRFGYGVHGGADDGNVQGDAAGDLGMGGGGRGNYIGARW